MGKGDKKSRKGKIARGTYGVRRPRKTEKKYIPTSKPVSKVKEVEKTVKAEKKEKSTEKKASPKKTTKKENKE